MFGVSIGTVGMLEIRAAHPPFLSGYIFRRSLGSPMSWLWWKSPSLWDTHSRCFPTEAEILMMTKWKSCPVLMGFSALFSATQKTVFKEMLFHVISSTLLMATWCQHLGSPIVFHLISSFCGKKFLNDFPYPTNYTD